MGNRVGDLNPVNDMFTLSVETFLIRFYSQIGGKKNHARRSLQRSLNLLKL